MGYDMHTVIKPEGEERAVAKANEAFHAAVQERDALPKAERGTYRQGIDQLGESPFANATPRYAEAQRKVSGALERVYATERSYFRLNIRGMGMVRRAMLDLGMVYETSYSYTDWPDRPEDGTGAGIASEAMHDGSDPREYATKYYDGTEVTDADIARATAYHDQRTALLKDHPAGAETIPIHKFGTNDGWIVTPRECLNALAAWHATPESARIDALESAEITGLDWDRIWKRWLAFLELAAHCDGFEVH